MHTCIHAECFLVFVFVTLLFVWTQHDCFAVQSRVTKHPSPSLAGWWHLTHQHYMPFFQALISVRAGVNDSITDLRTIPEEISSSILVGDYFFTGSGKKQAHRRCMASLTPRPRAVTRLT